MNCMPQQKCKFNENRSNVIFTFQARCLWSVQFGKIQGVSNGSWKSGIMKNICMDFKNLHTNEHILSQLSVQIKYSYL